MTQFTQDDVSIRVLVRMSCIVTAGAYGGRITKANVAELADELLQAAGGCRDIIDGFEIQAVTLENGATIIEADPAQ